MIPVMNDLMQYLELTDDGYKVKENCPADKLDELKRMNDECTRMTGDTLFIFK
jgi:hypothetical protein